MKPTHWTITLEEADDGSGDLILPFPEDLLESAGWKEGDTLEWIDNKDGSWILKKKDDHGTDDNTTK
jgi:hypothetical protein